MSDKKDVQNEIKESVGKIWLAGLGALAAAEEEGSKLFKTLVEKGEKWESKGRETMHDVGDGGQEKVEEAKDKAASTWDTMGEKFDDALASALKRFGVPAREEIATLTRRVEELTTLVESLKQPKKTAAPKPAAERADPQEG